MLRSTLRFTGLCAGLLICANAMALSLGDLSQRMPRAVSRTP